MRSTRTVPQFTVEVIASSTFFAPLSMQPCKALASSSAFIRVAYFFEIFAEIILDKSHLGCLWSWIRLEACPLTTRRIDVEENAEKNRENARLSVKTPTKNVEKVAYSGTHHEKTEYRNHKPRSN